MNLINKKYLQLISIVVLVTAFAVFLFSSVGIGSIFKVLQKEAPRVKIADAPLAKDGESVPAMAALSTGSGPFEHPSTENPSMDAAPKTVFTNGEDTVNPSIEKELMEGIPDIQGKIGRKNTVYGKLISCGLSPCQILNLTQAFNKTFDFRTATPDDKFQIFFAGDNQLEKFIYCPDPLCEYIAKRNENGGFTVARQDLIPEKKIEVMEISLESSLAQAIVNSGENQRLVDQFVDIFSWDIDFYLFPRKGDRITLLYEKYFMDDTFIRYGNILAAKYAGQNGTFSSFFFDGGYYDEQGHPLKKMFLRIPVKFGVKTSGYSTRRFHPVTKKYKRHTGIDYGARVGTTIFATARGKVIFSGWKNGYGKVVILQHPNGYRTYYAHCSRLVAKKGQWVDQGETIAKVGMTGVATGPHVHYEVRINNTPVDPSTIKNFKGTPLDPQKLEKFRAAVQSRLLLVKEKTRQNSNGDKLVLADLPQ